MRLRDYLLLAGLPVLALAVVLYNQGHVQSAWAMGAAAAVGYLYLRLAP